MGLDPRTVRSPLKRLGADLRVIHETPDWSMAIGTWDQQGRAMLIRWNGDEDHPLGNPVARGNATWFVLPEDLYPTILHFLDEPERAEVADWLAG